MRQSEVQFEHDSSDSISTSWIRFPDLTFVSLKTTTSGVKLRNMHTKSLTQLTQRSMHNNKNIPTSLDEQF